MDHFKQIVTEYVRLSGELDRLRVQSKQISDQRKELERTIQKFMEENMLQAIDTVGGKIKLVGSQVKPSLKKDLVEQLLTTRLGPTVASQVMHIMFEERESTLVKKVKVIAKADN